MPPKKAKTLPNLRSLPREARRHISTYLEAPESLDNPSLRFTHSEHEEVKKQLSKPSSFSDPAYSQFNRRTGRYKYKRDEELKQELEDTKIHMTEVQDAYIAKHKEYYKWLWDNDTDTIPGDIRWHTGGDYTDMYMPIHLQMYSAKQAVHDRM